MGFPVNSPKDDLDFVLDGSMGSAYFSSNRIGGVGQYDIYKAIPQFREIEVSVIHKESLKPVQNAALTVSPGTAMAYYTNTSGAVMLLQPLTGERELIVKKDGFKEQKVKLSSTNAYQVYLEPTKTSSSQPGEVRVVQDEKPVKNSQQVVNAPPAEKPIAPAATTTPVSMKEMYFIQIAALARNASLEPYSALASYGDLLVHENGMYAKVRLGTFVTEAEAKLVLSRIKSEGYPDAFVVKQAVDANIKAQRVSSASEYKVRLGTYAKVGNFNPDLVTHLGSIESYRKDDLTIMLLAGYSSLTAAQKARDAAASKGFTDAYVVMDNGGVFERVR
jgi:cell division septation protein DedD